MAQIAAGQSGAADPTWRAGAVRSGSQLALNPHTLRCPGALATGSLVGDLSGLLGVERAARGRCALMAIVNTTPDSFFDGGRLPTASDQRARVDQLLQQGAHLLDIGGESTRPGSAQVPAREQIERIDAALRHALARSAVVSVDTTLPEVAEHALKLGAHMVNDVSCLADPDLARVTARHQAHLLISHSRGQMSNMPGFSQWPDDDYDDIVSEVARDWERARQGAMGAGVPSSKILFDPGLGFSKNARHCFVILQRLQEFRRLGAPIVVGPGRKSFIAAVDGAPAAERLPGTIAACLWAIHNGADVLRVHDVAELNQALGVDAAIREGGVSGAGNEVNRAR